MGCALWHLRKLLLHWGRWTLILVSKFILQLVRYMVEKGEWQVLQRLTQNWWVVAMKAEVNSLTFCTRSLFVLSLLIGLGLLTQVRKETLLESSDLRFFQNHSSQMAALDYLVSLESDIFVPTYDGNMAKVVEGHRRYFSAKNSVLLFVWKVILQLLSQFSLVFLFQNWILNSDHHWFWHPNFWSFLGDYILCMTLKARYLFDFLEGS